MTLKDLLADGRIRPHKTSAKEIADLLRVVNRDLADVDVAQLSFDRRFATAYNQEESSLTSANRDRVTATAYGLEGVAFWCAWATGHSLIRKDGR